MKYDIVRSANMESLISGINTKLQDGWFLHGNLKTLTKKDGDVLFMQVVLHEEKYKPFYKYWKCPQ